MSPSKKRAAVDHVRQTFSLSVRRICFALGIARSIITYKPKEKSDEHDLVNALAALKAKHPDWGYRKMTSLLQQQGFKVGPKRVYRIWNQHGWQCIKRSKPRKKANGEEANACHIRKACKANQVWAVDFVTDRTMDGKPLKILTVLDEFTREGLAVKVASKMGQKEVCKTLIALMNSRGVPEYVRSDNGGEFAGKLLGMALREIGSDVALIAPGSPWQNGKNERFNGILRQEVLSKELWGNRLEAQTVINQWLDQYNNVMPHGSLGMNTPSNFAERAKQSGLWFEPSSITHPA